MKRTGTSLYLSAALRGCAISGMLLIAATAASAWIEVTLPAAALVSVISLQEPIQLGQRIAAHRVEALDAHSQWQTLCTGTTIGHKRLHRLEPFLTNRLRLVIEHALAAPALSSLQLFA